MPKKHSIGYLRKHVQPIHSLWKATREGTVYALAICSFGIIVVFKSNWDRLVIKASVIINRGKLALAARQSRLRLCIPFRILRLLPVFTIVTFYYLIFRNVTGTQATVECQHVHYCGYPHVHREICKTSDNHGSDNTLILTLLISDETWKMLFPCHRGLNEKITI